MIPYGRQSIDDDDIAAVIEVLKSDYLTQGPAVPAFERRLAQYCGARHALAVNSATSALHIACLALGVKQGDIVWTSPISFVASANCALYCGAAVDFVDIDPRTFNMSVEALREKLAAAERSGSLPSVVIPVHMAGQSCDMAGIAELAREYGFRVIEDASHAVGGAYRGAPVGGCQYSDITIFSFHPVKIITTLEGGLLLTNDPTLAQHMALLRSHGITRDPELMQREPDGGWYYEQIELGFNYRMTDVQAALGSSQMTRLDAFVARRRELAARYDAAMPELNIASPWQHPDAFSSYHLYVARIDVARHRQSKAQLYEGLRGRGVGVNLHYMPIYLQPYYAALGFVPGLCPEAERYYREAITLPLHPGMTDAQQDMVVIALTAELAQ
ncbi:MAG: UDP-4-amino-4,6-dideoxy-N-acetyl-beta-L-altrosamine transaminase [Burkholderiales bacterium]|nr:MAG: UDP-4-amino-4,6-dideoxy-N-acetyl-beta-L-altrosamine transaminase [Burkholderiales bacterium]